MKLIKEIKLLPGYTEEDLINAICKKIKINKKNLINYEIIKLGLDARRKPNVFYVLNVAINTNIKNKWIDGLEEITVDHSGLSYDKKQLSTSPVVVGFGPAGMFCALALAKAGLKPIVLERGRSVEEREKDVQKFWQEGVLNENSNVQFGEGGAGTFSDGKLNTTLNNKYCIKVINEFINHGAPKEIYYKNKAHIGTDNLKNIVKRIRQTIITLGGQVLFNCKFIGFEKENNNISKVNFLDLNTGKKQMLTTNNLILAIGHSALDTFEYVNSQNVNLRQKPFAMGVRIEHPASVINLAQYGQEKPKYLPNADYKLVEHLSNGRSVFTFCMCPGGKIVASSSSEGEIVTNGMSNFARNDDYSNSALLVNVNPEDYNNGSVLDGFYFQKKYERLAFEIGGSNYKAPSQTVGAFLSDEKDDKISCSYKPGVTPCQIKKCLPNFVSESLKMAIPKLDKKLNGFANSDAVIVAPETRSSCPVQFVRNLDYTCTISGLYACGEGAGYAGGIISSAIDGIKCAEEIINKLI